MSQRTDLFAPFPASVVKQVDKGKYTADYVSWTDKLQRLAQLGLSFGWTVHEVLVPSGWIEMPDRDGMKIWQPVGGSGDRHEPVAVVGAVTMTVDGVKETKSGTGQGRDVKTAETDAFARALSKFGLGLHLWTQGGGKDGGFWIHGWLTAQEQEGGDDD